MLHLKYIPLCPFYLVFVTCDNNYPRDLSRLIHPATLGIIVSRMDFTLLPPWEFGKVVIWMPNVNKAKYTIVGGYTWKIIPDPWSGSPLT